MDLYIALFGNDSNPGTETKPFASICAAQEKIKMLRESGLQEAVTVHITGGEYFIDSIMFSAEDSGTAEHPVVYRGEGNVVINGGLTLRPWDFTPLSEDEKQLLHGDAAEKVVRIDLTKYGLTAADWGEICAVGSHSSASSYDGAILSPIWCELFVNNERMTIARYPNQGYLETEKGIREGESIDTFRNGVVVPKIPAHEWKQIRNPISDIWQIDPETAKRASTWADKERIWAFGYPQYNWAEASTPVKRIDPQTCQMETKFVSMFGIRDNAQYYFFNVFEELDAPGEWYLNRKTGILYLYPPEDLGSADIVLSLLTEPLVKFENASYITLENITFQGTRSDALNIKGSYIAVKNCVIKNVAGNAVAIDGDHCSVVDCHIHHTGKGGILLNGGNRTKLISSGNVVANNHIHHFAQIFLTYQPAISMAGVGCVCRNNTIHDAPHMAIYFSGNNHLIEYNEIFDVCQNADDASAIYAGRDYTTCGVVIRCNYFHDLKSDAENHSGIYGVYFDDNLGGCTITKNLFLRCQGAIFLHGGHDMTVTNNLIIDCCEKSTRSIWFTRYGYWDGDLWCDNQSHPDSKHWQYYSAFERDPEVWAEAYPHFAEYFTWDPETEQSYAHYANFTNNLIVNHKPIDIQFNYLDPRFHNRIENNLEVPTFDNCKFCEIMPEFEENPFWRSNKHKII